MEFTGLGGSICPDVCAVPEVALGRSLCPKESHHPQVCGNPPLPKSAPSWFHFWRSSCLTHGYEPPSPRISWLAGMLARMRGATPAGRVVMLIMIAAAPPAGTSSALSRVALAGAGSLAVKAASHPPGNVAWVPRPAELRLRGGCAAAEAEAEAHACKHRHGRKRGASKNMRPRELSRLLRGLPRRVAPGAAQRTEAVQAHSDSTGGELIKGPNLVSSADAGGERVPYSWLSMFERRPGEEPILSHHSVCPSPTVLPPNATSLPAGVTWLARRRTPSISMRRTLTSRSGATSTSGQCRTQRGAGSRGKAQDRTAACTGRGMRGCAATRAVHYRRQTYPLGASRRGRHHGRCSGLSSARCVRLALLNCFDLLFAERMRCSRGAWPACHRRTKLVRAWCGRGRANGAVRARAC